MAMWDGICNELAPLIGIDRDLHTVNYTLKQVARGIAAPVVGALHVHCSDETERESVESFQTSFAQDLLPRLKYSSRAPFSTSNLGGQYEWGSLAVAEDHFATPESRNAFKLLAIKVNAHVAVGAVDGIPRYGRLQRYDVESTCCGLLTAMLEGASIPSASRLAQVMRSEGVDRVAMLREEVEPRTRMLAAAITSARLQARSAVLEVQEHAQRTPTVYLVVPTVTLNRADRDTELICGVYLLDRRAEPGVEVYRGLGDLPTELQMVEAHGHLSVTDSQSGTARPPRDHREVVRDVWAETGDPELPSDERIAKILARAESQALGDHGLSSILLKSLLLLLSEVSPVSAALLLFSEGAMGIYHAYTAHQLVREVESSDEARRMLADLHERVDRMPPEEVEKVLRVLLNQYGKSA